MKRIIYQVEGQPMAIMTPFEECGLSTLDIGKKDVPEGVDFWIVDSGDIPEDMTFSNAWRIDVDAMGEPHGLGGTYVLPEEEEQISDDQD